jgi:uncharacterized protein
MATETLYSRQLRVRVDGAPLPPLETALLWAEVTAVSSAPRVCRLGLSNWGHSGEGLDYLFFESGLLAYGAELEVALEGAEPSGVIFRGQLWGFSAEYPAGRPPEMVLLAYDRLKRLDQEPHTRAFVNQSIADVANQIASEHGLLPSIQLDGPLFPRLVQPGVTTWPFYSP